MHRMIVENLSQQIASNKGVSPVRVRVGGEEAKHAVRVKRLRVGETVQLMDGQGLVLTGTFIDSAKHPGKGKSGAAWEAVVEVQTHNAQRHEQAGEEEAGQWGVEVVAAIPKQQHLDELVAGLSQLGVRAWRPLVCARSEQNNLTPNRRTRAERLAMESLKQCGRPVAMTIGEPVTLAEALEAPAGTDVVVCDATGGWYELDYRRSNSEGREAGEGEKEGKRGEGGVRLVVGPEGGWEVRELDSARQSPGVRICRFGAHTMRIEVAAVAAAAVVLAHLHARL